MKIDADKVLANATALYREYKAHKYPYRAPELLPEELPSDQVRALCKALVAEINLAISASRA